MVFFLAQNQYEQTLLLLLLMCLVDWKDYAGVLFYHHRVQLERRLHETPLVTLFQRMFFSLLESLRPK